MGDRCTGHCCRNFFLPLTPEELKESYDAALDFKLGRDIGNKQIIQDIETIYPMVIFLGLVDRESLDGEFPPQGEKLPIQSKQNRYTCKNLQPNGDCGIYETRPVMCSEFPYDRPCEFKSCTWDKWKPKSALPILTSVEPPKFSSSSEG